ncbi:Adenylate cyclase 1 [Diplonema papillatum]|nr:Adenylate cyclase 1 [Diplonema papillatum]
MRLECSAAVCLKPLYKHLEDPSDDEVQRLRKMLLLPTLIIMLIPAIFICATRLGNYDLYFFTSLWQGFISVAALVHIFIHKKVTNRVVIVLLFGSTLTVFMLDFLGASSNNYRPWALMVLLLDVIIVCRLQSMYSHIILVVCIAWLLSMSLEGGFRFGWFDMPGTYDREYRVRPCSCEHPPCALGFTKSATEFSVTVLVFILDFFFTRGFADQVLEEQEIMKGSVAAARRISELLAEFDLNEAQTCLQENIDTVPPEFHAALSQLLSNLRMYEPFLPQSCLPHVRGTDDDCATYKEEALSSAFSVSPRLSPRATPNSICLAYNRTHASLPVNNKSHAQLRSPSVMFKSPPLTYVSGAVKSPATTHLSSDQTAHSFALLPGKSARTGVELTRKSVTILTLDVKNSLGLFSKTTRPAAFEDMQRILLSVSLRTVNESKGIVESFMGDHITASWNASRNCVSQRALAVAAATTIESSVGEFKHRVHIGISSGDAVCGNTGTESLLRYNIIGSVFTLAHELTRAAKDWDIKVLIDSRVQRDVAASHYTSVVLERVLFPKRGTTEPLILWEVLGANTGAIGEEWMYVVESDTMKKSSQVNQLAIAFLESDFKTLYELTAALSDEIRGGDNAYLNKIMSCVEQTENAPPATLILPFRTPRTFPCTEHYEVNPRTQAPSEGSCPPPRVVSPSAV